MESGPFVPVVQIPKKAQNRTRTTDDDDASSLLLLPAPRSLLPEVISIKNQIPVQRYEGEIIKYLLYILLVLTDFASTKGSKIMMTKPMETQKLMRAVQAKDYGDIDEVLSVEDTVKYPSLADLPDKKRKDFMIIKTHAVALACGDCRTLSGLTKEFQGPPSFPYVPGGDCSGKCTSLEPSTSTPYLLCRCVQAQLLSHTVCYSRSCRRDS